MSTTDGWADVNSESQDSHLPDNNDWAQNEWHETADDSAATSQEEARCFVCDDDETDGELITLPCYQHSICHDCFRHCITSAVGNETVYPLPCADVDYCGPIPDWQVEHILSTGSVEDRVLLESFQAKAEEYRIPAAFRTYCASTTCQLAQGQARFLDAEVMGEETAVLCPDCSSVTCRRCKELIVADQEHVCNTDDHNANVRAYIESLPDAEQWLWQKCPHCRIWVVKTEACNHMTCLCGGQFCLVCGKAWIGLVTCSHGCPHYATPTYDSEGYCEQTGFHKETGLDRDGQTANPNLEHEQDDQYNEDYDDADWGDEYDMPVYGDDGFDEWGTDRESYDRQGLDHEGYSRGGWDVEGYGRDGYNAAGFDRNSWDYKSMDSEGYFYDGCDFAGFDRTGVSLSGWPKEYFDAEMYDPFGYDVFGYSRSGLDFNARCVDGYTVEGYDVLGFDRSGYDAPAPLGFSATNLDRRGRNRQGYSSAGWSAHHKSPAGDLEPGYYIAPNGNVRRQVHEGPKTEVMECQHQAGFSYGSAECFVCDWTSDIFHQHCGLCGEDLCRACNRMSHEAQRAIVRRRYVWPGSDSYGIQELFERVEKVMRFAEKYGIEQVCERTELVMGFVEGAAEKLAEKLAVVGRRRSFSGVDRAEWVDKVLATEKLCRLAVGEAAPDGWPIIQPHALRARWGLVEVDW
ncbi:hypothetical protein LTR36_008981 [Oleoguttula mirabilis]|uniref:RING-type domain-containing protein n=1 Tax=Oleoguttula mirabilis TaxID=1507867 RepID=A0AAV9J7D1_9PEZI|nr:hypothetical protein LTR36_008981 [Oleoguttula mirabilis]